MDRIIDLIENTIDIPYIEENDAVQDGCFAITPYLTSFLRGDGVPVASNTQMEVTVFYESKIALVEACKNIIVLLSENNFICSDLSYTHDSNGNLYRANFTTNLTGGNDNE